MFNYQKKVFLSGAGVRGLTEDALLVFLVSLLRGLNKKLLFLSTSDSLNKRLCRKSSWFKDSLVYYPEKETRQAVPGFLSQYNRQRSQAIIKVATRSSVCCLSTIKSSKKADINKKTKPVVFKIKTGDVIDRDLFIGESLSLGYKKVETVFRAGDISVRGDIVDVFPVYEKQPIRVSFNFNSVETISCRCFFDLINASCCLFDKRKVVLFDFVFIFNIFSVFLFSWLRPTLFFAETIIQFGCFFCVSFFSFFVIRSDLLST